MIIDDTSNIKDVILSLEDINITNGDHNNIIIISNIEKRQHYFALNCQNKNPKDFYTHFRNFVTGQIRRSKKDYYEHKFNAAKKRYEANLAYHQ